MFKRLIRPRKNRFNFNSQFNMWLYILLGILAVPVLAYIIGVFISAPRYTGALSDHFDGKHFFNPSGHNSKGFKDVAKWQREKRERKVWTRVQNALPTAQPTPSVSEGLTVTFVGHSTVLLQFDGLNILTDPVWYERCSPFQFAGPKRAVSAGIALEDLPPIHLIVQSHNHWDHLDIENLKKIYKKHQPIVVTALGVSQFLKQNGIVQSYDLDWQDQLFLSKNGGKLAISDKNTEGGLTVTCLPAQHFSGRGLSDRNATLWASFMLSSPTAGNIYFAGDSGYANFFKTIGERFAPIRLALIPIGAYKPEWFMSPIHCSPTEAVQIHLDLGAERSLAIHHSTFPLADDGQFEPIEVLEKEKILRGVGVSDFFILEAGASEKI